MLWVKVSGLLMLDGKMGDKTIDIAHNNLSKVESCKLSIQKNFLFSDSIPLATIIRRNLLD